MTHSHTRLGVLLILVFLAGCIISEYDEVTITINSDGHSGWMEYTRRNLQSDESTPQKQRHDFEELLSNWKSDAYLIEKVSEGYYVKDRSLKKENGVLVWREKLLFGDFQKILGSDVVGDSLRFRLEHSDAVVSTNGSLKRYDDSTVVTWAVRPGTFSLKLKRSEFTPTSDFPKLFTQYQDSLLRAKKNMKR